jgi:peptidylprolyl isomerase
MKSSSSPGQSNNVPDAPRSAALNDIIRNAKIVSIGAATTLGAVSYAKAADDKYSDYTTTESGLKYKDLKEGEGATPSPGDTVKVHYTGWLEDFESPKKFDSSYDRRSPLVFKVGVRQVIAGWDEGLLTNLKVGGKRNLVIPAALGYGSRGAGGVIPRKNINIIIVNITINIIFTLSALSTFYYLSLLSLLL